MDTRYEYQYYIKSSFDLETGNVKGQCHRQRWQCIVLNKVYMHLKFESFLTMYLDAVAKPNC